MKTKILLSILMIMSLTVIATSSRSLAQTNPVFIQLGQAKERALQTGFRPGAPCRHRGHASRGRIT